MAKSDRKNGSQAAIRNVSAEPKAQPGSVSEISVKKLNFYQSPDLLVCDELGYLSLGSQGSHLFFQVISHRHQQKSTLLTTNLPFADWGKVFDSTTVATAIADRLVHNSEVFILGGQSYRRKHK